jgi:ubiquinone/menaquinone biosynthesis C-methylase UbiE
MATHPIFAAVYDTINGPLERGILAEHRTRLLGGLTGTVLDVGAGTGVNLAHLRRATRIVAAEPDAAMRSRLVTKLATTSMPVDVSDATAESLPFPDASFDVVVFTLVLCTVPDPGRALREAHRVLKPDGRLVALEHVRDSGRLATWQDHITPLWTRLSAGCHPNRDTGRAIERAGFTFERSETFQPMPRWVPVRTWLAVTAVRT